MQKFQTIIRAGFALILAVLPSTSAQLAAQDLAQPPVRMVYEEFPPYSYTDSAGRARGLSIDLATRLGAELGVRMEFSAVRNPAEMFERLANGAADMTSLLGRTEPRLALNSATHAVGAFQASAFVLKSHAARAPKDLSGLRVGAVTGSLGIKAAATIPFVEIVEFPKTDAMIVPLMAGELDAVVSATDSFLARLRAMGADPEVHVVTPALIERPYGFFVANGRQDLVLALNTVIDTAVSPDDLSVLHGLWFGQPTVDNRNILIMSGAVLLVGIGAFAAAAVIRLRQQSRRHARFLQEQQANQLLLDALNGVDAAIAIYDAEFNIVVWNEGFSKSHPQLADPSCERPDLRDIIAEFDTTSAEDDTAKGTARSDMQASEIIRKLRNGHTATRIVPTRNGKVYEASEFPVGSDRYASVRVDVTRLYDQAEEIDRQRDALEKANEQLQIFAAIAAHDLRAPLLQQGALLDFLMEDLEEAEANLGFDVEGQIGVLKGLASKMQTLVSDILEHSSAGTAPDVLETLNPNQLLPKAIELAGLPNGFNVEIAPDIPTINANRTAFEIVMRNLISNAAKHHDKEAGTITVRGFHERKTIVLEITDDGPGIPEKFQDTIFEPFKRLSSRVEGSGLGLAFVRKTVESWGGTVDVRSNGGPGSTFVIRLPRVVTPMPQAKVRVAGGLVSLH